MTEERVFALVGTLFLFALLLTINATFVVPQLAFGSIAAGERYPEYGDITFVGDVMLARNVDRLQTHLGAEYPFLGIADALYFGEGTAVVGNFEASIPSVHTPTPPLTFSFSVPKERIASLRAAGFTHVSLANNHGFDNGQEGFVHTNEVLNGEGVEVFGHPNSVSEGVISYANVDGVSVALVGMHALWTELDPDELSALVEELERVTDAQIAYIHWGNEYELTHSWKQREQAEVLATAGFDFIVGHHPHVVQDIEVIDGVPVLYSLGNFIFDQYFSVPVQQGLLVNLSFPRNSYRLELVPVTSVGTFSQPHLMSDSDAERFLTALALRSQDDVQEEIAAGVLSGALRSR